MRYVGGVCRLGASQGVSSYNQPTLLGDYLLSRAVLKSDQLSKGQATHTRRWIAAGGWDGWPEPDDGWSEVPERVAWSRVVHVLPACCHRSTNASHWP